MSARKIKTVVYKASLDIGSKTLDEFLSELRDAAKEQLYSSARWVWLEETKSDTVILAIEDDNYDTSYFLHTYKMNLDETFEFGEGVEVERSKVFVPKSE